jgi:membrane-associated protease RseP (regulator of RpoE activity)
MFSITLHEFGHFLPARLFKVPCPKFAIGFGPNIVSKVWRGTEWAIKWIWLGGQTQIAGMFPGPQPGQKNSRGLIGEIIQETRTESQATIPPGQEDHAFYLLSTPRKLLCMAGGILMNLLLGVICFEFAFGVIGVANLDGEVIHYGILDILQLTFSLAQDVLKAIVTMPVQLVNAVVSLFTGAERGTDSLISVVGIGRIAVTEVAHASSFGAAAQFLFSLLGSLNISLFVLNLFPLLPLDGGHVVNALYEGGKRTWFRILGRSRPEPADLARIQPLGYMVFLLLIGMGLILILADIFNPITI